MRSQVVGCGSYLPLRVMSNDELARTVDTSDEWIRKRTGIRERHLAADGEATSDLGLKAAQAALEQAGLAPDDLDLIVCATATPDETFPATATRIQAGLGMTRGAAFDVQAVCSGFIYALAVADNFIRCGQARSVLVIGAETFSRILDWEDRGTCVLFGDGAGAVLLCAGEGRGEVADRGVLSTHVYSDGRHHDALYVDGGPSTTQTTGVVHMDGREVYRHAVVRMAEAIDAALEANDLTPGDIDWLVPHQANLRIIESMGHRLNLPRDRVVVTVDRHANTSAASIPLALCEAVSDGRIRQGDLVLMEAMGGGFTWGSALVRW
ncbi:MAG: ketoacyl-ACP synthase III [Rhodospirillales bacterium]|nr:ketoacyl-ACP synthase III [Rhodospirillales bacterium]MDH3791490.1 ketoacyl-ACP synthase III [Rhodospirillales bacterium]MDH3912076.1 ketoacyl-ACP synthase III [Rhodospirillales bacterium]MDH3918396.1 ketoacyl-ACP synthase III [Rhodospirillales bacterium]MDH3969502.1 ketoacyl-ACP synthase III [Rhodospirillales bacterium]